MAATRRILIADANAPLRAELADLLASALEVTVDARETLAEAAEAAPGCDAVLLDAGLLESGAEPLRAAMAPADAPELILLGGGEAQMRALHAAVPSWAFEKIEKPFRFADLVVQVRDRLRQRWDAIGPRLGRFRFDPAAKLLAPDPPGEPVRLTEKEAEILQYLYRRDGPVEREALLRDLWDMQGPAGTHTLETHIYRLRQKLEADPSDARILVTEGGGYRLVITPLEGDELINESE
jgi:DNA-binding response OmpR family regulator